MLEQVLTELRNWFQVGIYPDEYTISGGEIDLPFLKEGQYFRILGSVFNDGLHQYGPGMEALIDETFLGSVWALSVPSAVVELAHEVDGWQKKYGETVTNPYASESFGGYSYSKAYGADGSTSGGWQTAFRARLNPYRKLREI